MNDTTVQTNKEPRLQGNMGVFQLCDECTGLFGASVRSSGVRHIGSDGMPGQLPHGYTS